jgi:hypothetical protein
VFGSCCFEESEGNAERAKSLRGTSERAYLPNDLSAQVRRLRITGRFSPPVIVVAAQAREHVSSAVVERQPILGEEGREVVMA